MMPRMDGFECLERLRTSDFAAATPVVILTAKELTDEDRRRLSGRVSAILERRRSDGTADEVQTLLGEVLDRLGVGRADRSGGGAG